MAIPEALEKERIRSRGRCPLGSNIHYNILDNIFGSNVPLLLLSGREEVSDIDFELVARRDVTDTQARVGRWTETSQRTTPDLLDQMLNQ